MRSREDQLVAAGAAIAFVGSGAPALAKAFAIDHAGPWPVLCDPSRAAFAHAGMRRGLWRTLGWRLAGNALRALRSGFRQGRVQGDPWQLGGIVVLAGAAIVHSQRDAIAGDLLDLDAVVAAVAASRAAR